MSSAVASDLRAIFDGGMVAGLGDGSLLERFASGRAEEAEPAFAALVARHGPMVLGVCRGVLRDAHDAEDAFQATFVTLARKASSIRRPDPLGPWLHGVAFRVARRLRDKEARRRRHEAEAAMTRASLSDRSDGGEQRPETRDEVAALHEEIARLPERYRAAIVLCDLQGLTQQEAGRRLGRPTGTIGARLSRARERLRGRLTRRGFALPTVVMGAAPNAAGMPGVLPAKLTDATIRMAMAVASGDVAAAVPAAIASLSRAASRSALVARWTMITTTVLALGAGATGVAVLAQQGARPRAVSGTASDGPSRPLAAAHVPATDALGDPLPEGARLRLGTLRFRPPSIVVDLALSPDEATIVTVGEDELIAWDAATGRERWRALGQDFGYTPPAAGYGIRAVVFSPEGSRFYTPGRPGAVVAWETATGRREILSVAAGSRRATAWDRGARSVDAAPDGNKLAAGGADGVVVCDRGGKVLYTITNVPADLRRALNNNDRLTFSGSYSLARFSPDGKTLAAVTSDRPQDVRLYDAETGRELRTIALAARLVRMAFSPDGRRLATTERDSAIRLYDVETGRRAWSRVLPLNNPFENYTSAVAFSPDAKMIAVGATDHRIHLVDASSGDELAQLIGHHWYPWTLAFSAKGRRLYSSGWDGAIRAWDVAARKQLDLPAGVRATSVIAASPDGRTLAYEDDSGAIRLVDAENGAERRSLSLAGTDYSRLAFSPDGRRLAGGGTSGDRVHLAVWDLPEGRLLHRWDWPKGRDPHSDVECLAFAPDGSRLAAAVFRQSSAYLWDLTDGRQVARLAHNEVYGLSFSPDGSTLATAGWDEVVRFWETDSGELRRQVKVADQARRAGPLDVARPGAPKGDDDLRMFAVCYAPGGEIIATAHLDGKVRIWQADDMEMRRAIGVPDWFREGSMCFSPDGLWLATGVADGRVDVWDPSTGANVWDRGRHQSDVYTVGFGRNSRTLVSGGKDGACYLWNLRPTGDRPGEAPARLWDALAGENGPAAYRAMWALAEIPDRAVALLAEKLRLLRNVIDLDRIEAGLPRDEGERRRRMRSLLIQKDPKVISAVAARRALALLAQIGTPDAIALLDELAARDPRGDLGRLAAAARDRARPSRRP
jgi:RNA polymerase sigma factor (sigma-70 family)